jgi:tetratricopeptide (TPR) repeat protein
MVQTQLEQGLVGQEVSITGRLASMTREEAQRRIADAGGEFVAAPRETTALLFVGQGGAPLGEDGRLTNSLRLARELQTHGTRIRIASEEELLGMLGLEERRSDFERLYTTAQLARILDLPQGRIRAWMRHGLIVPIKVARRLKYFDFRQVADAKALSRLTADGVKPKRIKESLAALEAWLPSSARSLTQLETLEEDGALVVRTDDGSLAEASGQLRLDFEDAVDTADSGDSSETRPLTIDFPKAQSAAQSPQKEISVPDAELWFQRGIRLEENDRPEEAVLAYARALDPGNPRAEVAFNLGNVLYLIERAEEACQCFGLATEVDPEYVEAWNNLGNSCVALERHDEAVEAYERALAFAPDYADAHFNLAETHAARGDFPEARKHWLAYLEEDPHSSWAQEVRARLRRTE